MAEARSLNKKSFYGASESYNLAPDIEMPPLDQTPAIAQAAPNPWDSPQNQPHNQNFPVPDQLPQETIQAMQEYDQEESVREEMSHTEPTREETSRVEKAAPQDPKQSFKAIREAKERAEQERDLLLRKMYEYEQYMQQQQQQKQPEVVEDDNFNVDIADNDLVEGKQYKKVASKINKLEKQLQQYENQNKVSSAEARLRSQYPDLDSVVSRENVERLREMYPEIARSLASTPDIYDQGAAAYKIIKNLGIHKESALEFDHIRTAANTKKPRPLASVSPQQGDSPLSRANAFANGLTDDVKTQLRKEMYAARKAL